MGGGGPEGMNLSVCKAWEPWGSHSLCVKKKVSVFTNTLGFEGDLVGCQIRDEGWVLGFCVTSHLLSDQTILVMSHLKPQLPWV